MAGSPTIPSIPPSRTSRTKLARSREARPVTTTGLTTTALMTTITTMTTGPTRLRPPNRQATINPPTCRPGPDDRRPTLPRLRIAQETPNARPDGHRNLQPRRARLRHLLAAAARADHLPRRRHRGPPREPRDRPAAVPRFGGPGEGHQPLHQLARRGRECGSRDLRHDAVPARPGQHDLHRHGGIDGGGPAGVRAQGQALRP